jgi:hypothetical protein
MRSPHFFWLLIFPGITALPPSAAGQTATSTPPPTAAQTTAQTAPATNAPAAIPSDEQFVNAIFHTVVDSSFTSWYLFEQADTCRFVKFNYDEWSVYILKEPTSIVILNELAGKVYASKEKHRWQQDRLSLAVCIDRKKADSVINFSADILNDHSLSRRQLDQAMKQRTEQWERLPAQEKIVFSFSRPQFTDDGQYAVIDLNYTCGAACGQGFTCIFRRTDTGWKRIAKYSNWSAGPQ